jgi:exopolysaccharide production protein ExoZ
MITDCCNRNDNGRQGDHRKAALVNNNIQVLRAAAAYMVVLAHAQAFINNFHPDALQSNLGQSGVDIFFVISGFIMVYTNRNAARSTGQFWLARIIRIVPMYWTATLVMVSLTLVGLHPSGLHQWDAADLVFSLLFIPRLMNNGISEAILSLGWTLTYEMFFYFVFGLTLLLRSPVRSVALITVIFLSLGLSGIVLQPASFLAAHYLNPIIMEFAAGCVLGLVYIKTDIFKARHAARAGAVMILLGVALGILADHYYRDALFHPPVHRLIMFGIPAMSIVAGTLALERSGYRCSGRFLLLQGEASYAVYLFHPLILHTTFKSLAFVLPTGSVAISVLITSIALLAVITGGTYIHLYFEKPLGRYLHEKSLVRSSLATV